MKWVLTYVIYFGGGLGMDTALSVLRWFLLGMLLSILDVDVVGSIILVIFIILNFEERGVDL